MTLANGLSGGIVMWPLWGLSLVATVLVLERLWFWGHLLRRQRRLIRSTLETYRRSPQAALAKLQQQPDLPAARIFLAALTLSNATPEEFRLALESAAQAEIPLLKRFSTVLETIVGIAPLLGLLGTIWGLIRSLAALQQEGFAGDQAMGVTAGIGEALISTAAGLVIAIMTLIFANLFQGLYRRQRSFLQAVGGELELLYRRQYSQEAPARADRA